MKISSLLIGFSILSLTGCAAYAGTSNQFNPISLEVACPKPYSSVGYTPDGDGYKIFARSMVYFNNGNSGNPSRIGIDVLFNGRCNKDDCPSIYSTFVNVHMENKSGVPLGIVRCLNIHEYKGHKNKAIWIDSEDTIISESKKWGVQISSCKYVRDTWDGNGWKAVCDLIPSIGGK